MMGSETVHFCGNLSPDPNTSFPFPFPFEEHGKPNFSFPNSNGSDGFPPFPMNMTFEISPEEEAYQHISYYSYKVILPTVFIFGIIGNILNIIIFSKSRFRHSLDEVEKSATTGLIALAVSDLLFCSVGLPSGFVSNMNCASCSYAGRLMLFIYNTYKTPLHNVFLFSSTWLTVAISIERYLAVCYPLHVRWLVRVKRTILIDISIYVVSFLFNIPEFLKWKFLYTECPDGGIYITNYPNEFFFKEAFKKTYKIAWITMGAFIPIIILTYCNVRLILEVSRSKARYSADRGKYTTSRITIILIAIIVLHIVLVCPTLVLSFFVDLKKISRSTYIKYISSITICNVLQTINFSINFILYCVMSKTFRDNLKGRTCKIHSALKTNTTPRTSSEEPKHKYQLVDMTTNQTSTSAQGTPTPSRANGNLT